MLRLVQIEVHKLRRRRIIWMMFLAALFMPLFTLLYFGSMDVSVIEPLNFYKWAALSYTPWIILPVVLGLFSTLLLYSENQYDMMKQLWIVPVSKTAFFVAKFIVVFLFAVSFMLITVAASILCGVLSGYIPFDPKSVMFLTGKCLEIGILSPVSVVPLLAIAASQKGYLLPICITLVYTFLGFILLMVNPYLHPLSAVTIIVIRNVPGVQFHQVLNIPAAFLCIALWSAASFYLVYRSLGLRK